MTEIYDPEHWLESTVRTIKDYTEENMNTRIFDVVMEFPGSIIDADKQPIKKTVIHYALDAIETKPVGFGDGMFADNYDPAYGNFPQYAEVHRLTFDVGVWASDRSGGSTSRMRARQQLAYLFGMNGGGAVKFGDFSDGGDGRIEVLSFTGGRFVLDTSGNDFRLYRMVDCMLELRVYSRTPLPTEHLPTIEEIDQVPNITILG